MFALLVVDVRGPSLSSQPRFDSNFACPRVCSDCDVILVKELPPVLITAMDSPGLSNSGAGDTSVSTGIRADGKAGVCKSAENDAMNYCCSAITIDVE